METFFPQLTPSEGSWRVDWLGNLEYQGYGMFKQPCISVSVSKTGENTEFFQQQAWLPVGSVPIVKVGDIWEDGKLISSPDAFETFPGLSINQSTVKMVKSGVDVDGAFLLPFEHHPWHRQHTNSYCVLVKISDAQQMLIPCMEMIRFYFGSSSNFLVKLFTQRFNEKSFWADQHFDLGNKHLHLKLPHWISAASATDIARIASSAYARNTAGRIYESCAKASSSRQPVYPCMGFPFTGKTSLVANGIWLPSQEGCVSTFVVHCLLNCSHPFLFDSLTYDTGKPVKTPKPGEDLADQNKPKVVIKSKTSKESQLVQEDPSQAKAPKKVQYHQATRFTDLLKKPVWHREIEVQSEPDVLIHHQNGELEKVAFGIPEGSGDARAIEACATYQRMDADEIQDLPRFVKKGIEQIRKDCQISQHQHKVNLLKGPDCGNYVFPLPMLVDEDGVINGITQFTEPDGTHRQRLACFVEIKDGLIVVRTLAIIEGQNIKTKAELLVVCELTVERLIGALLPK